MMRKSAGLSACLWKICQKSCMNIVAALVGADGSIALDFIGHGAEHGHGVQERKRPLPPRALHEGTGGGVDLDVGGRGTGRGLQERRYPRPACVFLQARMAALMRMVSGTVHNWAGFQECQCAATACFSLAGARSSSPTPINHLMYNTSPE